MADALWITTVRSHIDAGRLPDAERICRGTLQANPSDADALYLLGLIGLRVNRPDGAAECLGRAVQIRPYSAPILCALGGAMLQLNRLEEAEAAYRQALKLAPTDFHAWHNLAVIDERRGRLLEAAAHFSQAAKLWPGNPLVHLNLGTILRDVGELDAARRHFEQAVQLQPDLADAHMGLAWLLLMQGDFSRGWAEYEWRWRCPGFQWPKYSPPLWDGTSLEAKTILLHAEQGLGDTIQFVRYAPLLAQRGAVVAVLCPRSLHALVAAVGGVQRVVSDVTALPQFDCWCPLLSLPLRFGTTLETIPGKVPYVTPDAEKTDQWRERLRHDPPGLRIGFCWAGNRTNMNDENRSIPPKMLEPLNGVANVVFYNLQVPADIELANALPFRVIDHTSAITDFSDTAALISQLDLVISVDTAVAHLSGAMGKQVWTLLRFAPDFRWLLDRPDSPWYPTMRLFRKKPLEPWPSLIQEITAALEKWSQERRG